MSSEFLDEFTNENINKVFVSLGNYCLTSMLLKKNNLKYESHPFDWMVTCIDNVIEIFDNNFVDFLDTKNYEIQQNLTTKNIKYFSKSKKLFPTITEDHMHHNLLTDEPYQYLYRTVERVKNLHLRFEKIIFIMIQPLYLSNSELDIEKIKKLYDILYNIYGNKMKLVIFNIIKECNYEFKKDILNENLIMIELDTTMEIGYQGMKYFDSEGIKKFIQIINEI
jgi:hypothetical protein